MQRVQILITHATKDITLAGVKGEGAVSLLVIRYRQKEKSFFDLISTHHKNIKLTFFSPLDIPLLYLLCTITFDSDWISHNFIYKFYLQILPGYEDRLESQNFFTNVAKMPNCPNIKAFLVLFWRNELPQYEVHGISRCVF